MAKTVKSIPDTNPQFSLGRLGRIAGIKIVSEKAIAGTPLGNGNWRSGAAKLASGVIFNMVSKRQSGLTKRLAEDVSVAHAVDGAEDNATDLMRRLRSRGILGANNSMNQTQTI